MGLIVVAIVKRITVALSLIVSLVCAYLPRPYGYAWTETVTFTESGKALNNPNQGFYFIYGFTPSEEDENFQSVVAKRLEKDTKSLAMIQINLRNYSDGLISERGLKQIDDIFKALEEQGKQYLIRFLYDWNGKNMETEPDDAEIILNHMNQLETIFREYEDIIFVQQGLFIGNWGEMNGTKHLDSMEQLALCLAEVTGENTFLAVRMPAQWRTITRLAEATKETLSGSSLAGRLGLFNDGIMGNAGDYGTYGTKSKVEAGDFGLWNREEELEFQSELCRYVPNGGEVIRENPLNDFEAAVENLKRMHVSYLNRDYDRTVLEKWEDSTVTQEGCFYGMDGLTYIERHLGYRLYLKETEIGYDFWKGCLSIEIALQNGGFAPIYREAESWLTICKKETGEVVKNIRLQEDVRKLAGGMESEQVLTITENISMSGIESGKYEVYFAIKDVASGRFIELANEQNMQEKGYRLGEFFFVRTPAGVAEEESESGDNRNQ